MNENDFDFDSTVKSRKSTSRRRKDPLDDDNLDAVLDSALMATSKPQPQPRTASKNREDSFIDTPNNAPSNNNNKQSQKAVSGWGEEDLDLNINQTARSRRRDPGVGINTDFNPEIPQETKYVQKKAHQREFNKNDEQEIPEIPDLEETTDMSEDMAFKVAEAPDVQVHQISTYKELDKEFFREKAFQFLEGNIDVSLLHCGLSTEQQIAEEEDVIWEWNKLFTEVVSVLTVVKEQEISQESEFNGDDEITRVRSDPVSQDRTKREREINF